MRKLLVLAFLLALLVGADLGARIVSEEQLEGRLEQAVPASRSSDVRLESFPFLGRLAASGSVPEVKVRLHGVVVEGLHLSTVAADLHDVDVDRRTLLREQRIRLLSVGRSTGWAEITQGELSRRLGIPVELGGGRLTARVGGQRVSVPVSLANRALSLGAALASAPAVRIPDLPLLPCVPRAQVVPGALRLTCALSRVPDELLEAVQRRAR